MKLEMLKTLHPSQNLGISIRGQCVLTVLTFILLCFTLVEVT